MLSFTRTALCRCLFAALLATAACKAEAPEDHDGHGHTEQAARADDWCAGHGVPESQCTRCNPELIPQFKAKGDWCGEHGLPESQCVKCNPELANKQQAPAEAKDWCAEHGLPESQCTKCNPQLVEKYIAAGDFCRAHGYPESVCPICKGTSTFPPDDMRVRLASQTTAKEAGIETVEAQKRALASTLEVVGTLEFDPNRRADLSAIDAAVIRTVYVDVGDAVKAGDPLVTLVSAGVGARRADLGAARTTAQVAGEKLAREERLFEKGLGSRADLEAARSEAAAARAALQSAQAGVAAAGGGNGSEVVLRAPFAGVVVVRAATAGHTAQAGETLVTVADPRTVRARLDIPERHAADVRAGQAVTIELTGGHVREGTIAAVGAAVDPVSRSLPARVDLDNADGALKGGSFVRARIATGDAADAVVIPRSAVQRLEGKSVVFVLEQAGSYRPVAVQLGAAFGDLVAVREGLKAGDPVVTTGAFLLATETRKDAIGAGCCEVE